MAKSIAIVLLILYAKFEAEFFGNSQITYSNALNQWFSNCASRRPDASFQFSKGVAGYFGFMPLSLGFIASKEL